MDNTTDDPVSGYINVIPTSPGMYFDLSDPEYPRVYGCDLMKINMQQRPIIVLRNEKDLEPLLKSKDGQK